MTPLLLLAAAAAGPPADWTFHDAAAHAGRSVVTFRTVELADNPARPLPPPDAPPAGARYGVLPVGPRGQHRLAVVWHPGAGTVWVDADADGRFAPGERHVVGAGPVAVTAAIPFGDADTVERTVLVRRRGDGLAYAVRGYVTGPLVLGGETYPGMLTDGDADGCFDGAAADRVWVDADRDGRFDPLTEQFPLGRPVAVGPAGWVVKPDPIGRRVSVTERTAASGTLTAEVSRLPGAKVVGLSAQLVSDWGELVTVTEADEPQPVPAGRYRVESLELRLEDPDGRVWEYRFAGTGRPAATVEDGKPAHVPLTAGLRVTAAVGRAAAGPGGQVEVSPEVRTAGGLVLTDCRVFDRFAAHGRGAEAVVRLAAPGSETLAECRAGFW